MSGLSFYLNLFINQSKVLLDLSLSNFQVFQLLSVLILLGLLLWILSNWLWISQLLWLDWGNLYRFFNVSLVEGRVVLVGKLGSLLAGTLLSGLLLMLIETSKVGSVVEHGRCILCWIEPTGDGVMKEVGRYGHQWLLATHTVVVVAVLVADQTHVVIVGCALIVIGFNAERVLVAVSWKVIVRLQVIQGIHVQSLWGHLREFSESINIWGVLVFGIVVWLLILQ